MTNQDPRELRQIANDLKAGGMRCNCDLDNWEPDRRTGHSCVFRIHKEAMDVKFYRRQNSGQS